MLGDKGNTREGGLHNRKKMNKDKVLIQNEDSENQVFVLNIKELVTVSSILIVSQNRKDSKNKKIRKLIFIIIILHTHYEILIVEGLGES